MSTSPLPTTTRECLCGCGRPVTRTYLPGHDAKHVAFQMSLVDAGCRGLSEALADMPTPAMYNKLVRRARKSGYRFDSITREFVRRTALGGETA